MTVLVGLPIESRNVVHANKSIGSGETAYRYGCHQVDVVSGVWRSFAQAEIKQLITFDPTDESVTTTTSKTMYLYLCESKREVAPDTDTVLPAF